MAVFNVVQKRRRAAISERKRQVHGDPVSGKLHLKQQPLSVSGKRKRKLEKKWRREQKEAVEKGLITIQDIEMAVADSSAAVGTSSENNDSKQVPFRFSMKRSSKFRIKQLNKKPNKIGKNKKRGGASTDANAMVE